MQIFLHPVQETRTAFPMAGNVPPPLPRAARRPAEGSRKSLHP